MSSGSGELFIDRGRRWTVEEDESLLAGKRELKTVPEIIKAQGLQRSVSASRRHLRHLLKQQSLSKRQLDDDDRSSPASRSSKRRKIARRNHRRADKEPIAHYTKVTWTSKERATLIRLMADGYGHWEIREMPVAKFRTSEGVRKKTKRLEDVMLRDESRTESFPCDTVLLPGWTPMHSLRLRRAVREDRSFEDLSKKMFSEFAPSFSILKKKVDAYKKQMRGQKPPRRSSPRESHRTSEPRAPGSSHSSGSRADEQLSSELGNSLQEAASPIVNTTEESTLQTDNNDWEVAPSPHLVFRPSSSAKTPPLTGKLPQKNRLSSKYIFARESAASPYVQRQASRQSTSISRMEVAEPVAPAASDILQSSGAVGRATKVALGRQSFPVNVEKTHEWNKSDQQLYNEAQTVAKSGDHVNDCYDILKLSHEQVIAVATNDLEEVLRLKSKERQQRRERRVRYGKALPRRRVAPLSLQPEDEESADEEVGRYDVDDSGVGYSSQSDVSCIWAGGRAKRMRSADSDEEQEKDSSDDEEAQVKRSGGGAKSTGAAEIDVEEEEGEGEEEGGGGEEEGEADDDDDEQEDAGEKTTKPTERPSHVSTDAANAPLVAEKTQVDSSSKDNSSSGSSEEEVSDDDDGRGDVAEDDTIPAGGVIQVLASQDNGHQDTASQADATHVSSGKTLNAQSSSWIASIPKMPRFFFPNAPKPREEPKYVPPKLPYGSDDEKDDSSSGSSSDDDD